MSRSDHRVPSLRRRTTITSALDLELNLVCPDGLHTDCSAKRNVTNVRLGLTAGQHTFRGEWWASGDLRIVREAAIQFVS